MTGLESTSPSFTRNREKDWNSELDLYESARKQGIQPATTNRTDIEYAIEVSNRAQRPFQADEPYASVAGSDGD